MLAWAGRVAGVERLEVIRKNMFISWEQQFVQKICGMNYLWFLSLLTMSFLQCWFGVGLGILHLFLKFFSL